MCSLFAIKPSLEDLILYICHKTHLKIKFCPESRSKNYFTTHSRVHLFAPRFHFSQKPPGNTAVKTKLFAIIILGKGSPSIMCTNSSERENIEAIKRILEAGFQNLLIFLVLLLVWSLSSWSLVIKIHRCTSKSLIGWNETDFKKSRMMNKRHMKSKNH